jgi:transcription-repair coupling factor (superfamily II helicase)
MQLKSINEKFLPDLLQKEFGKEIFTQLENSQHIAVKVRIFSFYFCG